MHTARSAIFLCLLGFALTLRAEEWILRFEVREERIIESPKGDAPSRTETRNYIQTVALGTDYLAVEDEARKTVYDFAGRRMRVAHLAAKTQSDWSLYFLPSFSEHELWNLTGLGVAMRAIKSDRTAAIFERFDNETAMRVTMPATMRTESPPPVIETSRVGDAMEFRHQGRLAVRFVPAAEPLPAAWYHRFVNYLTYTHCIHPEIRRAIAETGAAPRELGVTWRRVGMTATSTLRLVSSAAAKTDSSHLPAGLTPSIPTNDPLYPVLARVTAVANESTRPGRDDVVRFVEKAVKGPHPLDAVLALLEYGLQSGEQMPDLMRRHTAVFKRDPACAAYLGAFGDADKAQAEKNLATNAGISREGLAKAHMLELQRANLLERVGRQSEALDAFLVVLKANPYHTGALHDLGALYLRGFEHEKAWLCWDAARRLYPGHPMMREIVRREMDLVRNHPDFF